MTLLAFDTSSAAITAAVLTSGGEVLSEVTQLGATAHGELLAPTINQALELARFAGAQTRTPIVVDACRRVDDRPPQASLPWRERAKNIRGAFIYNADLSGKKIAVVDDVMTSRCCARVRRKCRGCRRPLR